MSTNTVTNTVTKERNMSDPMQVHASLREQAGKAEAKVLGELVWWSMSGVEVNQCDLQAHVDGLKIVDPIHGTDIRSEDVCPNLQERGGLRKALEELGIRTGATRRKGRGRKAAQAQTATGERVLFSRRLEGADAGSVPAGGFVTVLVEETVAQVAGRPEVGWAEVQRITYNPETRALSFATPLLEAEIREGFRKWAETYRSTEVSRTILALIERAHGILARESGGVYFLPRQTMSVGPVLDAVTRFVPGASVLRWPVLDAEGTGAREQTLHLAGAAIKAEMLALQEELATLEAQTRDPRAPAINAATLRRRVAAYKVLKEKARTYRELLQLQDDQVKEAANKMVASARALLVGNDEKRDLRKGRGR